MEKSRQLTNIFSASPKYNLADLEEDGIEFELVELIDHYTRKHTIGYDDMAGFVFIKNKNKFKVYWAFQGAPAKDRSYYQGLYIYPKEIKNLLQALDIIEGENELDYILGTKNSNNRELVKKLISEIKISEELA